MTSPVFVLTKHHGLGNDFLVLSDQEQASALGPAAAALARLACDRHRGVGADGLLLALPAPANGSADITMRLFNADGSVAEMSGNGIRCFAQAVVDAGLVDPGTVRVMTDGGLRAVEGDRSDADGTAHFRVAMGLAGVGGVDLPATVASLVRERFAGAPFLAVDLGNPHLVVRVEPSAFDGVDIAVEGPRLEAPFKDGPTRGINVEIIRVRPLESERKSDATAEPDIDMVVWERGVGVTQACGTGATASAVAACRWGFVERSARVHQPGGSVRVELERNGTDVLPTLIGPTQFIAAIEFPFRFPPGFPPLSVVTTGDDQ